LKQSIHALSQCGEASIERVAEQHGQISRRVQLIVSIWAAGYWEETIVEKKTAYTLRSITVVMSKY
jgi:hypothetical protein